MTPIYNVKRSSVNVYKIDGDRSVVRVSASFQTVALTAGECPRWGGKLSGRGNVRGGCRTLVFSWSVSELLTSDHMQSNVDALDT